MDFFLHQQIVHFQIMFPDFWFPFALKIGNAFDQKLVICVRSLETMDGELQTAEQIWKRAAETNHDSTPMLRKPK
ncbi:hypothetical protein LINGRAHAP2_LOCUS21661 [Linum grandiflorum]